MAAAVRRLGRLDVLVNNAALFFRTPVLTTTPAQFDRLLAVNLRAPFFLRQAAARAMGRRGGRIVNIADVGAVRAWPGYMPYGISKAGVLMLTRGLAVALAPRIQVNAVAPGVVLLPEGFPRESGRRLAARIPMGRHGRPDDVAPAVRFFATCSDYITGQVLFVDGACRLSEGASTAPSEPPPDGLRRRSRRSNRRYSNPLQRRAEGARVDLDVERSVGAELAVELDRQRRGRVDPHPSRAAHPDPRIGEVAAPVHRGEPARQLDRPSAPSCTTSRRPSSGRAPGAMRMPPPNEAPLHTTTLAAGPVQVSAPSSRTVISAGR